MESHWEVLDSGTIVVSNTPQELWKNACKYFKWCDQHPIPSQKTITSGKEVGKVVTEKSIRAYTIKGLCLHCGIIEEYLRDLRNTKDVNSEYYIVVSRILYVIYTQNQENATVGLFNPIFTAKVLNMEEDDTPVQSIKIEYVGGLPPLSKSENEVLELMEKEQQQVKL